MDVIVNDDPAEMISPICSRCNNFTELVDRKCKAFPDGIPEAIWYGKNDHTQAYDGDNGVRYDPIIYPK